MQLQKAKNIMDTVVHTLWPFTSIINPAGSVRRLKNDVKDIEIVCLPHVTKIDLFGEEKMRVPDFVTSIKSLGQIAKGDPATGRYVQVQLKQGIMLDLFIPQEHDYYRQWAIRTGSADYSHKVLAAAWLKKGWCGTVFGLRLQSECQKRNETTWQCVTASPTLPPVWESERDLFEWLGIPWIAPVYRESENKHYNEFLSR